MTEKICKKCLLEKLDPVGILHTVRERVELMDEEEKVDEDTYLVRLKKCAECDKVSLGTCALCGCFVEYRAARKDMSCPAKYW